MYNIAVIMGGVMPVPAVCGGAIETLITSIVKKYSSDDGFHLTIFSVYHKDAVEVAKKYPEIRFVWTHTNTFWNLFKHVIFLTIRQFFGISIRKLQRHYNEIAPILQKEKYDLILVEGGEEQAVIDIAKEYRRDQFVLHAHVQYHPKDGVAKGYGHMIGVSDFVVREYVKHCHYPVKAHTLKNSIDYNLFHRTISKEKQQKLRMKLGIRQDDFVILYVGRIIPMKGILELMQAVLLLNNQKIKLIAIGSSNFGKLGISSYEKKVKMLAKKNKDQFIFTGYIPNEYIYRYAAIANVQCVPTLVEEAAGLVALEAMAAGIPTIVTNSGGMKEYVTKKTSVIIEKDDIKNNLKHAISYLMEHPEVRKKMSKAAILQGQLYSEDKYYKNFVKVIEEIKQENNEEDYGV